MKPEENAAIHYQPDDAPAIANSPKSVPADAENHLMRLPGVTGVGMTRGSGGDSAIVVYVIESQVLETLPKSISGLPVIGEVTGPVRAL